jgi:hypothetical protein
MHEHTRALTHTLAPAQCTSVEKLLSGETENYDTTFHFVDNDLRVTSKTFCKILMFLCLCLLHAHNKKHSPCRKKIHMSYMYIYVYMYEITSYKIFQNVYCFPYLNFTHRTQLFTINREVLRPSFLVVSSVGSAWTFKTKSYWDVHIKHTFENLRNTQHLVHLHDHFQTFMHPMYSEEKVIRNARCRQEIRA